MANTDPLSISPARYHYINLAEEQHKKRLVARIILLICSLNWLNKWPAVWTFFRFLFFTLSLTSKLNGLSNAPNEWRPERQTLSLPDTVGQTMSARNEHWSFGVAIIRRLKCVHWIREANQFVSAGCIISLFLVTDMKRSMSLQKTGGARSLELLSL